MYFIPSKRVIRHLILALTYGTLGVVLCLTLFIKSVHDKQADLKPWHQWSFDNEYQAGMGQIHNLADYQRLEASLFNELMVHLSDTQFESQSTDINRFNQGSWVDPFGYKTNWNRTQIYKQPKPKAAVLLLHGLSDSPYSLRKLAQKLHADGAYTVALRMPGHGTSPSGLLNMALQ